jgi:hypothetical protein
LTKFWLLLQLSSLRTRYRLSLRDRNILIAS